MKIGDKIRLLITHHMADNLESIIVPAGTVGEIILPPNEQATFIRGEIVLVRFPQGEDYIYDPHSELMELI